MGINVGSGEERTITCDDPNAKGCREKIGPRRGVDAIRSLASQKGWFLSETTGKATCPGCQ